MLVFRRLSARLDAKDDKQARVPGVSFELRAYNYYRGSVGCAGQGRGFFFSFGSAVNENQKAAARRVPDAPWRRTFSPGPSQALTLGGGGRRDSDKKPHFQPRKASGILTLNPMNPTMPQTTSSRNASAPQKKPESLFRAALLSASQRLLLGSAKSMSRVLRLSKRVCRQRMATPMPDSEQASLRIQGSGMLREARGFGG